MKGDTIKRERLEIETLELKITVMEVSTAPLVALSWSKEDPAT